MKHVLEILQREARLCLVQLREIPNLPADSEEEREQNVRRVRDLDMKFTEIRNAVAVLTCADGK